MKARKLLDKEEFDYDHFTRLTSTGIEPDYNTIAQFAEKYHQDQLKLLNIDNVTPRLIFDEGIKYAKELADKEEQELDLDITAMIAKDYTRHVAHYIRNNVG